MAEAAAIAPSRRGQTFERALLLSVVLAAALAVAAGADARYGPLRLIGVGFGATLEGLRFGFAGPWRARILRLEPGGLLAQLLAVALVAVVAIPLLERNGAGLVGAHSQVGFAMLGGAFVFGAAMQVVLGCGSGTLVNAGSGNPVGLLALPFFAVGSFAGAYNFVWWTELGSAPVVVLDGTDGLLLTLGALAVVALLVLRFAAPSTRRLPGRLRVSAGLVAALAIANLVVASQPRGVVYGLGLWAGKGAQLLGADLSASAF